MCSTANGACLRQNLPIRNPEHSKRRALKVRPLSGLDRKSVEDIRWAILDLALQKSPIPYDLNVSQHFTAIFREAAQMEKPGAQGNLVWASASTKYEEELPPVRVPQSF